jgi:glucokinase
MAHEALSGGADSQLEAGEEFDARMVHECAVRGDAVAIRVFERVGRALGLAIANMVNALNLPLYVIGGGVSSGWDAFSPALFAEVRQRSFIYDGTTSENGMGVGGRQRTTRIMPAMLGGDGGLYGAPRLPMIHAAVESKA